MIKHQKPLSVPAMKVTCSQGRARRDKLALVARGVSTRTTVQILAGHPAARRRRAARPRRDRHGALAARLARGAGRGRGRGRRPGTAARRHRAAAARPARSRSSTAPRRASPSVDVRHGELPAAHVRAEDFPRLPEVDPDRAARVDREALLETIARVSRSASRDESRPVLTGHPRPLRGRQARDGRDRLLPAVGEGDRARGRPRRSSRRSCRRARSPSSAASRQGGDERSSSACTRTRSSSAPTASG